METIGGPSKSQSLSRGIDDAQTNLKAMEDPVAELTWSSTTLAILAYFTLAVTQDYKWTEDELPVRTVKFNAIKPLRKCATTRDLLANVLEKYGDEFMQKLPHNYKVEVTYVHWSKQETPEIVQLSAQTDVGLANIVNSIIIQSQYCESNFKRAVRAQNFRFMPRIVLIIDNAYFESCSSDPHSSNPRQDTRQDGLMVKQTLQERRDDQDFDQDILLHFAEATIEQSQLAAKIAYEDSRKVISELQVENQRLNEYLSSENQIIEINALREKLDKAERERDTVILLLNTEPEIRGHVPVVDTSDACFQALGHHTKQAEAIGLAISQARFQERQQYDSDLRDVVKQKEERIKELEHQQVLYEEYCKGRIAQKEERIIELQQMLKQGGDDETAKITALKELMKKESDILRSKLKLAEMESNNERKKTGKAKKEADEAKARLREAESEVETLRAAESVITYFNSFRDGAE